MISNSNISRRRFGKASISGIAATIATTLPRQLIAEDEDDSRGWIDAHVHVWHPDTKKYPISSRFQESDMQPKSFTASELFAHSKPVGVDRIVLIQMSFYEDDHTYMSEVMRAHPNVFSGVALIDHRSKDLSERVGRLAKLGMRGLRIYSKDMVAGVDAPSMEKLWKLAAKNGLAICPLINPADIGHVDVLSKRFPDTTVVVDHFARIGVSGTIEAAPLASLCKLARLKNTYVKTSAFYALGEKSPPYTDLIPMIRQVVDAFGPERLMWASDCPYQVQGKHDYESSLALIRDKAGFLSDGDKRWMLSKTAEKVFFA